MQRGSQPTRALEHHLEPPRAQCAFGAFVFPALCAGRESLVDISAARHRDGTHSTVARRVWRAKFSARPTGDMARGANTLHASVPGAYPPGPRGLPPLSHPRPRVFWRGLFPGFSVRAGRGPCPGDGARSEVMLLRLVHRLNTSDESGARARNLPLHRSLTTARRCGCDRMAAALRIGEWRGGDTGSPPPDGRSACGASCLVSVTSGCRAGPLRGREYFHTKGDAARTVPGMASMGRAPHAGR